MGSDASTIPEVDISAFTTGSGSPELTAKKLNQALRTNGFVGLKGHGIPSSLVVEAFDVMKALYSLPYSEKMKAPHPEGITPHRGYSGFGTETVGLENAEGNDPALKQALNQTKNLKETYEIGSDENLEQYNIWLPEDVLPGFRSFSLELYWKLHETAGALLNALIASLGLSKAEANYVKGLYSGHDNQLRYLHYPEVERNVEQDRSRLGAHCDWGLFTLCFQDECGGLEYLDRARDEYMPVPPKDGIVYVNIADMFMRLSNGLYPSTKHRVITPKGTVEGSVEKTPERYSMVYFVGPPPDVPVSAPESLLTRDRPIQFEPTTYREMADRNFAAIRGQY